MRHDSEHVVGASLNKVKAMSLQELDYQLPLAQNSLEAIELELEDLMALRDAHIIRVAAMRARRDTLQEPNFA